MPLLSVGLFKHNNNGQELDNAGEGEYDMLSRNVYLIRNVPVSIRIRVKPILTERSKVLQLCTLPNIFNTDVVMEKFCKSKPIINK